MARPTRLLLPETPVHEIQRGNNRGACFVHRRDATNYLAILDEARQICGVAIHAYVLMTNHVHLLATPPTTTSPAAPNSAANATATCSTPTSPTAW
ncbi:transposase [Halomonas getboli]|uniref:transposase n=1 Tax=Halomonas getboli TaxID=2935862 RepID=UPI00200044A7|nr:transposase [Halomonas getboli]MCK2183022.1 transposase [Halomonas getboli]